MAGSDRRRLVAWALAVACLWAVWGLAGRAQQPPIEAGMHTPLAQLLDLHVRDGQVYYHALQFERAKLDAYVASLGAVAPATYEAWPRAEQLAFWINAYNAFVLRTVIDHYPIRGGSPEYPERSIRQIAGAFNRQTHRAAGRAVTLDQIETDILPAFGDPRVYLALGRGAVGGPRLRSEAFTGDRLEAQLAGAAEEFASRIRLVDVDTAGNVIRVNPIVSWRAEQFIAAYADDEGNGDGGAGAAAHAGRSPIERAILHLIEPHLLPMQRRMIERNDFTVRFSEFDWRLNDLTGGRVD